MVASDIGWLVIESIIFPKRETFREMTPSVIVFVLVLLALSFAVISKVFVPIDTEMGMV